MLHLSSTAAFSQTSHSTRRSSLFGFSSLWKRSIGHAGIKVTKLDTLLIRFPLQCCSSRRPRASRSPKSKSIPRPSMEKESRTFYVVRKGDAVGIYKTLTNCQAQVSSSVCDPSVGVYKGYSLSKDAEEYLASRGLKNAIYTISSVDVKEDLFGALVPCPFQQPDEPVPSTSKASKKPSLLKRLQEDVELEGNWEAVQFTSKDQTRKLVKLGDNIDAQKSSNSLSCILEFDGASKGNPGKAGAGAILRAGDGSVVWRLREGLGIATNNVAEYLALILGMKHALQMGFKRIQVRGDSNLVCMQVQNLWQTKNKNMADLCKEAKELKDKFLSFQISHVGRELNSEADAQANLAVSLGNGEVCTECNE